MVLLAQLAALLVGVAVGLQLPDVDQVFVFLAHRSIVTHSFFLPLAGFLLVRRQAARWPQIGVASMALAVAIHLAFDLFPRGWRGTALIQVPFFGALNPTLSVLWLLLCIVACSYVMVLLVKSDNELSIVCLTCLLAFAYAAAREAAFWLWPSLIVAGAVFLATCLPNHIFDGQAAARRVVERIRRRRSSI